MLNVSLRIKKNYRTNLERIFFSNPRQSYHIKAIDRMIEKYGNPIIIEKDGFLEMKTHKCPGSQSLFFFNGPLLLGIIIYKKNNDSHMDIIHIAMDHNVGETDLIGLIRKCFILLKDEYITTFTIGYLKKNIRYVL